MSDFTLPEGVESEALEKWVLHVSNKGWHSDGTAALTHALVADLCRLVREEDEFLTNVAAVMAANKDRAEAAEVERDALKAEVERLKIAMLCVACEHEEDCSILTAALENAGDWEFEEYEFGCVFHSIAARYEKECEG